MRIRFYAYFYPPCVGGGEVILQHQAEELVRRGHEVHVHVTPYTNLNLSTQVDPGYSVEGGVHVWRRRSFRLPFHNPLETDAVTPAFLTDAMAPANLRIAVGYPSLHLDWLLARTRWAPAPLIVQNYITADFLEEILAGEGGRNKRLRARYWRHHVRRQLARASAVIADSPAAARALEHHLGLTNVRTHIGMAVDPAEFARLTPADGAAIRARLRLGDDPILLAPSRVSHQKGADLLVRALSGRLPDRWRCVVAGPVNEPAFAAEVDRLAAPLGDRYQRVTLPRAELLALMLESDIVCLPSRGETVGGVVFEGMYAGALAVVSDAVEAAREVYLSHEENGLLVRSADVDALADALTRAMSGGEDLAAMRAAGRAMVEAQYTWSRSVDHLLSLYDDARGQPT